MAADTSSAAGPLAGIRVLDLTRVLAGPSCTQLLGDLGADVIKVEKPGEGDDTRRWGPPNLKDASGADTAESAYYLSTNRNKRSVAIDVARPQGAALVRRLAAHSDVLVENFKVGGLAKYGLAYPDLRDDLPRLVYCSITGFGQTGPNAHRPGYDFLAQGMGGIMSITGEPDGEPVKVGVAIADIMCGMYATTAILAALRHRDATGMGQHIDIGLADTQVAWLYNEGMNYLLGGKVPTRRGNAHANIVPYQVFETADGHVIVAVGNDSQFRRLCDYLGRPELAADPRFATNPARTANRGELVPLIAAILKTRQRADILAGLESRGVPVGPVNDIAQALAEPQVAARDMLVRMAHPLAASGEVTLIGNPLKFSESPITYRRPPPTLGEHTDEVLAEILGLDEADRRKLRDDGAI
ncbi:crotonobetainyl-CoA:carnitine CoA-transferase CaiB-like acyl-CoA transferase [Tepidamorphus gemmatus]|uniref:Crotonobetainyl-CoA:carnitine CoA-transferase CaiB-like acyl-CoA transferase n=1 Tax=Tepidamorphus gemmatus TaxID=747076 RepID=A0A4R3MHJ3_9HYPH|nr:CaiB/BaiF CoA-transferase family protein [Tepidamorphus gemmatus]TCT11877.1 crotonobetainyl-CoA:carnitine CoA-transferase CaiB-like acyl-CoA transferase [Tepidamorphus gemmatus]